MKHICKKCMNDLDVVKDDRGPIPKYTVFGGIVGTVVSGLIGAVLIPAGLGAGMLVGLGADAVRSYGKAGAVFFDAKGVFDKHQSDGRI